MRRSIQDLVSSVDPNVRIEPEVEDVSHYTQVPRHVIHRIIYSYFFKLPTSLSTRSRTLAVD
jgi:hypothetical protein